MNKEQGALHNEHCTMSIAHCAMNDKNDNTIFRYSITKMSETPEKSAQHAKKIYFFIGRTTPPHAGHIYLLEQMILLARKSHTPALILLGNGPNKGQRTKENPVEHETKAAFIRAKLAELGYHEGMKPDYVLELMIQPPNKQIVDFVSSFITGTTTSVDIIQVAGKKGLIQGEGATAAGEIEYEDLKKHSFVRDSACKTLRLNYDRITFDCDNVQGIDALTGSGPIGEMSATKVRKAAVDCFGEHSGDMEEAFRCWLERFPYYKSDNRETLALSKDIFTQIIRYKDVELHTSSMSKRAQHASQPNPSSPRHSKTQTARKSPSPKSMTRKSSRSPSPRGNGKGGSRRSRNIRFRRRSKSIMLHNKTKHNRKK